MSVLYCHVAKGHLSSRVGAGFQDMGGEPRPNSTNARDRHSLAMATLRGSDSEPQRKRPKQNHGVDSTDSESDSFSRSMIVASSQPTYLSLSDSSGIIFSQSGSSINQSNSESCGAYFPSDTDLETSFVEGVHQLSKSTSLSLSDTPTPCNADSELEEDSIELDEVSKILVTKCKCKRDCLLDLSAHTVLTASRKFCSLSVNGQRQWLTDNINENSNVTNPQNQSFETMIHCCWS